MDRHLNINRSDSKAASRAAFELPCAQMVVGTRTDAFTALAERCMR
jgi:hypothetical protein